MGMVKVTVIQLNAGKRQGAHYSILEQATRLKVDIVALQEPYMPKIPQSTAPVSTIWSTISAPSFDLFPPLPNYKLSPIRPRTLIYVRKGAGLEVSPRFDLFEDTDIQAVEVKGAGLEPFLIVNCYNEKDQHIDGNRALTISRALLRAKLPRNSPILLVGDFNLHHPRWNASATAQATRKASSLVSWLDNRKFTLLVDGLVIEKLGGTFFRAGLRSESILDLAFITGFKKTAWRDWQYLEATGSDHEAIFFTATCSLEDTPSAPIRPLFNLKKLDEEAFARTFKGNLASYYSYLESLPERPSADQLDLIAKKLTEAITGALGTSAPKLKVTERSKRWWSEELTTLRKEANRALRRFKRIRTEGSEIQWHQARSAYSYAIKSAKAKCWDQFLEQAKGKNVFLALKLTKPQFTQKVPELNYEDNGVKKKALDFDAKCDAFLKTLFDPGSPPSPTTFTFMPSLSSTLSSTPLRLRLYRHLRLRLLFPLQNYHQPGPSP